MKPIHRPNKPLVRKEFLEEAKAIRELRAKHEAYVKECRQPAQSTELTKKPNEETIL